MSMWGYCLRGLSRHIAIPGIIRVTKTHTRFAGRNAERNRFDESEVEKMVNLTAPRLLEFRDAEKERQSLLSLRANSYEDSEFAEIFWRQVSREDFDAFHVQSNDREYGAWEKVESKETDSDFGGQRWYQIVIYDEDMPTPSPASQDAGAGEESQTTVNEDRGRIVSHAKWVWKNADWDEESQSKRQKELYGERQLPDSANKELLQEFDSKIQEIRKKHISGKEHYCESTHT
ncbi:MAG: hypothetical protein Q9227_008261 [Pyrenula ochraceoflavens]